MISNKILLMIISVLVLIMGLIQAADLYYLGEYRWAHGVLLLIIGIIGIVIPYMNKE
jgi:hypothetical protein